MMVYASATSGYKSGGFNETSRWCVSTGAPNQGPVGSPTATCPVQAVGAAPLIPPAVSTFPATGRPLRPRTQGL